MDHDPYRRHCTKGGPLFVQQTFLILNHDLQVVGECPFPKRIQTDVFFGHPGSESFADFVKTAGNSSDQGYFSCSCKSRESILRHATFFMCIKTGQVKC